MRHLDIGALTFKLTPSLLRHAADRVRAALAVAPGVVTGATARMRDVNGPKGGIDMGCRIVVALRGRGTVVVDAIDRDLYAAIDSAAAKLREAIRRRLKRRRTLSREYAHRRARHQFA